MTLSASTEPGQGQEPGAIALSFLWVARTWVLGPSFPSLLSGSWIESEAARARTRAQIGCCMTEGGFAHYAGPWAFFF